MQAVKEKTVKQSFPKPKRFTLKDIEKLYKLGFLKADEKIEIINGEIYKMSPIGLRHLNVVNNLNEVLNEIILSSKNLKEKYLLSIQNPLKLYVDTVLQPDIAVLNKSYIKENRYPTSKDTELVIEVSDTTLSFDKNVKIALYAKYKVQKVWIINLIENQIEVYEKPKKNKYTEIHIRSLEDTVEIFNTKIKVKEIIKAEGKK